MPFQPVKKAEPPHLATVSSELVNDWLRALERCCTSDQLASILQRTGLSFDATDSGQRVSFDQIVQLYQIAAIETEDEMMGLWTRPVRARALQHLLTTVREARSLPAALYRFSTFWNLLLDDYRLEVRSDADTGVLELIPIGEQACQRFGHMLILKLAHGLLSWLHGYETPVMAVRFAFDRPNFAEDYAVIFPSAIEFSAPVTSITFQFSHLEIVKKPGAQELKRFLENAPRDWIFTGLREHTQSLQVREFLYGNDWETCNLAMTARALKVTPRTLLRRLDDEQTSFQEIKNGLRRDLAIRDLQAGQKSIEEISQDVGFSSAANFHRAFRQWTGATPNSYRRPMMDR